MRTTSIDMDRLLQYVYYKSDNSALKKDDREQKETKAGNNSALEYAFRSSESGMVVYALAIKGARPVLLAANSWNGRL